jgi:hypothetical protein
MHTGVAGLMYDDSMEQAHTSVAGLTHKDAMEQTHTGVAELTHKDNMGHRHAGVMRMTHADDIRRKLQKTSAEKRPLRYLPRRSAVNCAATVVVSRRGLSYIYRRLFFLHKTNLFYIASGQASVS